MILLLAAVAVMGGVVLTALGRGGEMAFFHSDSAPLRLDGLAPADVALLRPPLALWGYNVAVTEEALGAIAAAMAGRDTEIAALRRELDEVRARQLADQQWPYERRGIPAARGEVPAAPAGGDVPAWPGLGEPGPGE